MGKTKKTENKSENFVLWADLKIIGMIGRCIDSPNKTLRLFKHTKKLNFNTMNHVSELKYDDIGYVYFKVIQPEFFVQKKLRWNYNGQEAEITLKKLSDCKDGDVIDPSYSVKRYQVTYKLPIKVFEIMVTEDASITAPLYCNGLSSLQKILMYCMSPYNIELRDKNKKKIGHVLINEY